jgi:hypothetical protein
VFAHFATHRFDNGDGFNFTHCTPYFDGLVIKFSSDAYSSDIEYKVTTNPHIPMGLCGLDGE